MAARKLTGNSGKAISSLHRVPWSSLNLPETFRSGSVPERFRSGSLLPESRGQQSLLNTFPFNQQELDHPQEHVDEKDLIHEQDDEVVEKVNVDEADHQEEHQAPVSSLGLESRDS